MSKKVQLVDPQGIPATQQPRHIGVALVAHDRMHTRTALDLITMISGQIGFRQDKIALNHHGGTVLAQARNQAAKELLETGCEWVLFVDSDMRFPGGALERLLAWDVPVVAANCSKRKRPIGPTARVRNFGVEEAEALFPTEDDIANDELVQVETVGTGFMLVKSEVFLQIEWPWFSAPYIESKGKHIGEDVFFCGRCHEAGIPIFVDPALSWTIKHIGDYEFGMQDVLDEKAAFEAGLWDEAMMKERVG